jgi:hypothetical protein
MDFFAELEQELRAASQRPRRRRGPATAQAVAAVAALSLVVSATLVVSTISRGGQSGRSSAASEVDSDTSPSTVTSDSGARWKPLEAHLNGYKNRRIVMQGTAPPLGAWVLEADQEANGDDPRTAEEESRDWCLILDVSGRPGEENGGRSGVCGLPRTLDLGHPSGLTVAVPQAFLVDSPDAMALVSGRAPEEAEKVVVTMVSGRREEVEPVDGPNGIPGRFFVISWELHPRPDSLPVRIDWFDAEGRRGSEGLTFKEAAKLEFESLRTAHERALEEVRRGAVGTRR